MTTSQITTAMRISNDTAKRTMTEFKGLELVTMERTNKDSSNSEYKITLNPKFNWFLTEKFSELRNGFKPTSYTDLLKSNKSIKKDSKDSTNNSNNKEPQQVCCEENTPCVSEKNENAETTTITTTPSMTSTTSFLSSNTNDKNNSGLHKGENTRSKDEATVDGVLVKVSNNKKDSPMEMTKEQYDSWAGNKNENEI